MELSENIEKQLEEIEILKSIYPNPREFSIEDDDAIYEANEFLCDKDVNKILKRRIGYIIKCEANCDVDEASSSSLVFKNDKNNNDVLSKVRGSLSDFLFFRLFVLYLYYRYPLKLFVVYLMIILYRQNQKFSFVAHVII